MTDIARKGRNTVDTLAGKLTFEQGNNRIIGRDNDSVPRLLIQANGDDFNMDVSKPGIDVLTATNDEKIFSSNFNLYKIINFGSVTNPTPRNATITLSGSNIGYVFEILIDVLDGTGNDQELNDDILVNICWDKYKISPRGSGVFYDDGTNKVNYKWSCGVLKGTPYIYIIYELRLTAGSYSFNPATSSRVPFTQSVYYQVSNMTNAVHVGGGGGGSTGDGKFYFYDLIYYYSNGSIKTALSSSTQEFMNGDSAYFPSALI